VPPSRRRDKPIVSCTLCRRRKLKCDRQQPCKTCMDRGLALSCIYTRNAPAAQEPKAPHSVHDRIDQLEKLVTTLMSGKDANPTLSTVSHLPHLNNDNGADVPGTPDRMRFTGDTTSYASSAHWTSILDGVSRYQLIVIVLPDVLNRYQSFEIILMRYPPQHTPETTILPIYQAQIYCSGVKGTPRSKNYLQVCLLVPNAISLYLRFSHQWILHQI